MVSESDFASPGFSFDHQAKPAIRLMRSSWVTLHSRTATISSESFTPEDEPTGMSPLRPEKTGLSGRLAFGQESLNRALALASKLMSLRIVSPPG